MSVTLVRCTLSVIILHIISSLCPIQHIDKVIDRLGAVIDYTVSNVAGLSGANKQVSVHSIQLQTKLISHNRL